MTKDTGLRLLRAEDYVTKPWKNGGGVTRDVLLWPASENFDIRVSLADIPPASTFSAFPGITRHITRLCGETMVLTFADGQVEHLELLAPLTFDSGKAPTCEATGSAVRVLNVMTRESSWRASVEAITDGLHEKVQPCGLLLVHAVDGAWTARSGYSTLHFKPTETLLAKSPNELHLTGSRGAKALLARFAPVDESDHGCSGLF